MSHVWQELHLLTESYEGPRRTIGLAATAGSAYLPLECYSPNTSARCERIRSSHHTFRALGTRHGEGQAGAAEEQVGVSFSVCARVTKVRTASIHAI